MVTPGSPTRARRPRSGCVQVPPHVHSPFLPRKGSSKRRVTIKKIAELFPQPPTQAPDSYLSIAPTWLRLTAPFFTAPLDRASSGFYKHVHFLGGLIGIYDTFFIFCFLRVPWCAVCRQVSDARRMLLPDTLPAAWCLVPGPPRTATATGHRVRAVCRVSASACRCPVPSAQCPASPEPRAPRAQRATCYPLPAANVAELKPPPPGPGFSTSELHQLPCIPSWF
jgi:hypothetical protein